MPDKILLTISILISNRPDTVRKCLDSIQRLLREVPSELILTDTGCGEEVRSVIEEYTDHIIEFTWCRDFSKARNAGLKQARGKWFLFLDDDEWFEDTSEIIRFFQSGEYKGYGLGAYIQRNYLDEAGATYTDLPVSRMVRLDPGLEFIYSIHEIFSFVPGKVKLFSDYVHHYGYVYKTEEEARAHAMRNIELLLEEHEKSPQNMKHTLQLVKEYCSISDWENALKYSMEGIDISRSGRMEVEFCLNSLFCSAVEAYQELHREEEGIEAGERYLAKEPLDPLARAMILGLLAQLYVEKGETEKCMSSVSGFRRIYEDYRRDKDAFIGYVTTVTSDCFEQRNRSVVLGCGVRAALALGRTKKALTWFQEIEWKEKQIFVSSRLLDDVVRAYLTEKEEKRVQDCRRMCDTLLQRTELAAYMRKCIEKAIKDKETGEQSEKVRRGAALSSEHWYFELLRAAGGEGNLTEYCKNVWGSIGESLPYIVEYDLCNVIKESGIDAGELFSCVKLCRWRSIAAAFCGAEEWGRVERFDSAVSRLLEPDNWYLLVWREAYLFAGLFRGQTTSERACGGGNAPMLKTWYEYGACVRNQAYKLYREEAITRSPWILPASVQAAFRMEDLERYTETGDYAGAVETLKAVKELLPELDGAVKDYLRWLKEKMDSAEQEGMQARSEMTQLALMIKGKARQLMQAGNTEEARRILEQLQGMLPEDGETAMLLEQMNKISKDG